MHAKEIEAFIGFRMREMKYKLTLILFFINFIFIKFYFHFDRDKVISNLKVLF